MSNRLDEFWSLHKKWWWLTWSWLAENSRIEKIFYRITPKILQKVVQISVSVMLQKDIYINIKKIKSDRIKISICNIKEWMVNEEIIQSCIDIENILLSKNILCDVHNAKLNAEKEQIKMSKGWRSTKKTEQRLQLNRGSLS